MIKRIETKSPKRTVMVNKKTSASEMREEDSMPETEASKDFLNFLVDELKNIYWVEKQLAKALPAMRKAASAAGLKDGLSSHLATTRLHAERLEQIFDLLGENARANKSEPMAGILEEMVGMIKKTEKGAQLRDAGILLAVQKIAHCEIAAYEAQVQLARTMGNEDIIALLEETLMEEKGANEFFTAFAEEFIIYKMAAEERQQQPEEAEKG